MKGDKVSNGSISMTGYKVEIRTTYFDPQTIGNFIVTNEWRVIPVELSEGPNGVPVGYFDELLAENNLMNYAQAQAIRWSVLAKASAQRLTGSLCLETRLKKYHLSRTTEITEGDIVETLDSRGGTPKETETKVDTF